MTDFFRQYKQIPVKVTGRNLDDLLPLLKDFPVRLVEKDPAFIITHGGDGSLLGAERDYPGIPKCPIRDRRQNPKCPEHDEYLTLKKLFAGELQCTQLIHLTAETAGTHTALSATNDLVLTRKIGNCSNRFRVWVDNELICPQVIADSLVFCTPFGSTGYFQSITGGMLKSGIGIAFNNSMDRPEFLVASETSTIRIALLRGAAVLMGDNNPRYIEIPEHGEITVFRNSLTTPIYGLDIFRCPYCYQLRRRIDPAAEDSSILSNTQVC